MLHPTQKPGEDVPEDLTKVEASEKIEELQEKTSRGAGAPKARPRKRVAGKKKS